MLALQRSVGNATATRIHTKAVQRAPAEGAEPTAPAPPQAEASSTTYRLQIQVRKDFRSHRAEFREGHLGHAWVALYTKSGSSTSFKTYGFYPTGEISSRNAHRTVGGRVMENYDLPDGATTTLDVELTADQAQKLKDYALEHRKHDYSLTGYNCTTFARGAYKAATGKSAPGFGLPLLENPSVLQDAIKRINQRKGKPRKGEAVPAATATANSLPNSQENSDDSDNDLWVTGTSAMQLDPVLDLAYAPDAAPVRPTPGRFEID